MSLPKPNQRTGPLSDHVRKKRVYASPLAATGSLQITNWVKDDLPDLLWPALVLAERGNETARQFVRWQEAVQGRLTHHDENAWVAERLDGRLTHLAALAERFPDARRVVVEEAVSRGLLSAGVRNALGTYPDIPANWMSDVREAVPPQQRDIDLLHDAVLAAITDGHREALMKCLRTWSTVQAGTFSSDAETIELLKDYPTASDKRDIADTVVRATWGAHKALLEAEDPGYFDSAIAWARMFWGINSATSLCIRRREIDGSTGGDTEGSSPEAGPDDEALPSAVPEGGENFRRFTMDLLSSFVEALETSPAHLYESARQEVVSGLVASAGRELMVVLGAPDLWCAEHGSHVGRRLVETKIYLHWMARQETSIYLQFQEYGAGKAKLYSRIADELPEEARTAGFRESIDELKRLSHNDDVLDHRIVDTRDSFAEGKSLRAMAEEAGLIDLYRQAYSLASGVSHSEWWAVETHAMEPCLNVLHGMHRIPSLSVNPGGDLELARAWIDQFYSLVRAGLQILGTNDDSVNAAFAWVSEDRDGEDDQAHI